MTACCKDALTSEKILRSLEMRNGESHEAWQTRSHAGKLAIRAVHLEQHQYHQASPISSAQLALSFMNVPYRNSSSGPCSQNGRTGTKDILAIFLLNKRKI